MTITNVPGYPNGLVWGYTYYDNNWLKSVTDSDGKTSTYDYDAVGNGTSVIYPNGVTGMYSFKEYTYRLGNIRWQNSYSIVLQEFQYAQYDTVGNIGQMYDETGSKTYTYDNLYQLTDVVGNSEHPYQESFTYDDAGNRLTYTPNIGGSPYNYVYNKANELTSGAGITYTYDLNGNQKSKQIVASGEQWSYQYDYKDQLTQIVYPDMTTISTFKYDGDGRRTQNKININGKETNYYWDGINVVLETDGSNNVRAVYTHGVQLISKKVQSPTSNAVYKLYYLYDHLGNTRAITDEWGNIVNTYYYDAFGKCRNTKTDPGNKHQYVGGYGVTNDEDSGLLYMRARYYDPTVGRFITRDPVEEIPDYVYCENNPLSLIDPFGLSSRWVTASKTGLMEITYWNVNRSIGEIRQGGSRAWRNNNPGVLERGIGAIGTDGRCAIFPDEQTGRNALRNLLTTRYSNATITGIFLDYAPGFENDTAAYQSFVVKYTGLSPKKTVNELSGSELELLMEAIIHREGFIEGTITPVVGLIPLAEVVK